MFATEPKKRIRNHVTISKTDSVITKRPGPLHRVTVTGLPAGMMLQLPTAHSTQTTATCQPRIVNKYNPSRRQAKPTAVNETPAAEKCFKETHGARDRHAVK